MTESTELVVQDDLSPLFSRLSRAMDAIMTIRRERRVLEGVKVDIEVLDGQPQQEMPNSANENLEGKQTEGQIDDGAEVQTRERPTKKRSSRDGDKWQDIMLGWLRAQGPMTIGQMVAKGEREALPADAAPEERKEVRDIIRYHRKRLEKKGLLVKAEEGYGTPWRLTDKS